LLYAVLFLWTDLVVAQERVDGSPTCGECGLEFDTIAVLGGLESPGADLITDLSRVAIGRDGRIYVSGWTIPEIAVFRPDGSFLGRFGGEGDGPGEFRLVSGLNITESYVHVFDPTRGRTMFDSALNVVRTDRFPGQVISSTPMAGDSIAFVASIPTPQAAGLVLHLLGPEGGLRSFGAAGPVNGRFPNQVMASNGEDFWTVEQQDNRLAQWSRHSDGGPLRRIFREVREFERDNPDHFSWPRSLNRSARLDQDGLWVVWHSPDEGWSERHVESGPIPNNPPQEVLDGWLDLIDPGSGATVLRVKFDEVLLGFAGGEARRIVVYREDAIGVPFLTILAPRKRGP
jgi:hypothetical protein